jgi:hypothetical protein
MIRSIASIARSRGTAALVAVSALSLLGLWACGTDSEEEPTLKMVYPANGATIAGPTVQVKVATTHFNYIGKEVPLGKTTAIRHDIEGGHVHVYLDHTDDLDANARTNIVRGDTATISIPTAGKHYIIVVGANGVHEDVEGMRDSVEFTVTLP